MNENQTWGESFYHFWSENEEYLVSAVVATCKHISVLTLSCVPDNYRSSIEHIKTEWHSNDDLPQWHGILSCPVETGYYLIKHLVNCTLSWYYDLLGPGLSSTGNEVKWFVGNKINDVHDLLHWK